MRSSGEPGPRTATRGYAVVQLSVHTVSNCPAQSPRASRSIYLLTTQVHAPYKGRGRRPTVRHKATGPAGAQEHPTDATRQLQPKDGRVAR